VTSTRQSTAWPKTHAAELNDVAVASAFDDAAVMRSGAGIDEIATEAPQARQGAIVRRGESTVPDNVGTRIAASLRVSPVAHPLGVTQNSTKATS
jgi:hypothetical protein